MLNRFVLTRRSLLVPVLTAALVGVLGSCDDSGVEPPTSKKVALQLSAEVGAGDAGRSIALRAYYRRTGGGEVSIAVEPVTIALSTASTATQNVSAEVLPCITDANREIVAGLTDGCRVYVVARLMAPNGATVSEDEIAVSVTKSATSLVVESFTLPSGALTASAASVDFAMGENRELPAATTVTVASSSALGAGALASSIEYVSGSGWLSVTIPAGEGIVTLAPTATNLAVGTYEAIVRVTSARMFTPVDIRVVYRVPPPPKTVTITGAGNGTGLVLVSPNSTTCTTTAGTLSGFCAVPASHGSQVRLTASPAVGTGFTGWSGACAGTADCVLIMDQDRTVMATFTILKRELTVNAAGTGSGVITSSPSGIACTASSGAKSGGCVAEFDHPTQVTLTATPTSATSAFTGWGGACTGTGSCVVTMTEARSVTATFVLLQRQLTVTIAGEGAGTVTSSPAGIACTVTAVQTNTTCSASFPHGTPVVLTATPGATDMTFTGWSGAGCTGTGTCTVTMDAARTVTATIVPPMYVLTVNATGNGQGGVRFTPDRPACSFFGAGTCTREFPAGSVVELTATLGNSLGNVGLSGCEYLPANIQAARCRLTMNGPRTVEVAFITPSTDVTVLGSGTGAGTVTGGSSLNCVVTAGVTSGTCRSVQFGMLQSEVYLLATPGTGSTFSGWVGCPVIISPRECKVGSFTKAVVTASFTVLPPEP